MQVFVRDNDINSALRVLKRQMQREGTFREMKRRRAYEKPSERRSASKQRQYAAIVRCCASAWSGKDTDRTDMEYPSGHSRLPVDYFRRHAARVRALARDATTPAVKQHLHEVALAYERLADCVDESGASDTDSVSID